eukprot:3378556-Alexandrium_andersonii.AAC.1
MATYGSVWLCVLPGLASPLAWPKSKPTCLARTLLLEPSGTPIGRATAKLMKRPIGFQHACLVPGLRFYR